MSLLPGEIYWAFDGTGSKRPYVVVSREELNRGDYLLAVPFTTAKLQIRKSLPNCVYFQKGAFGLPKECVAQADALTQRRKTDLVQPVEPLGKLSDELMRRLVSAVGNAIAADCLPVDEARS